MHLVYSTSALYRITEMDSKVLQRSRELLQNCSVCVYIYIANHCNVY